MTFFTKKDSTYIELTFKFLIYLCLSYFLYFTFIKEYATFLLIGSANTVAFIFDMHINSTNNYLENITLISNTALQHSITQKIDYAAFPLNKVFIDKILVVITNSAVILALLMLLVRSLKTLIVILLVTIAVHFFSISSIMTYLMFEVSPKSQILTAYLKATGVTQLYIDITFFLSSLSMFYLKYFTPLWIAYYAWDKEGHVMIKYLKCYKNSFFNKRQSIWIKKHVK